MFCAFTSRREVARHPKTLLTDEGPLRIEVPRDRHGAFEPQIVGKHERRFTGFDDKIIALYSRGLTVREVQAHLQEMYAVEVSPDLISKVPSAFREKSKAHRFQSIRRVSCRRPLHFLLLSNSLKIKSINIKCIPYRHDICSKKELGK